MASSAVPRPVRRGVRDRAGNRCEYCQHPESHSSAPFTCDHVTPRVRGAGDTPDELAWACAACNGHKHAKTHATDPQTGHDVPLFNPRRQRWGRHFTWSPDFRHIIGRTATGRATIEALHRNRPQRLNLRHVLFIVGLHPPEKAQETMVIEYVNAHGRIARRDAVELCRLSDDEALSLLSRLVAENKLQRRGVGRGTYYELANE
ncbi:MAG: HNH endonuclease signature motif containing protein [Candidatus Poribacteria bacterium]|nr:HNH endonuclease signature motif containing protein [Candidatus Poribacteria bacterium]